MKVVRARWPERESEILVALHSGMRRSEQFRTAQVPDGGLKWLHIDFRAGIIRLPRSKSGKTREIPMNSVLRKVLRSLPRPIDSPYVFEETDPGKWLAHAVKAAKVKAVKAAKTEAAKIEDFHWHDFRHTFASRLAMAGIPIRNIAELMGHSELQTTLRYAHLTPGHLADAVECLTAPQPVSTGTATSTSNSANSAKAS